MIAKLDHLNKWINNRAEKGRNQIERTVRFRATLPKEGGEAGGGGVGRYEDERESEKERVVCGGHQL